MGRKKNMQTRQAIQDKAYELFRQNGYHKTAMSELALALDVEKTLIQYYFPKKELLAEGYLRRLLELSAEACRIDLIDGRIDLGGFYRMGILYFDYLLKYKLLSRDIFADRRLTNHIIDMNLDYARVYLSELKADPEKAEEEIVMAMGGVYELLYRCLVKDEEAQGEKMIRKVIVSFVLGMGGSKAQALEILDRHTLDDAERKRGIQYIERHL